LGVGDLGARRGRRRLGGGGRGIEMKKKYTLHTAHCFLLFGRKLFA
jgi:hypothetical protein